MKREMSQQAQVAKLCRQFLKSKGIKCTARSSSFSMGDSVSVDVDNQPPEVMKMINEEFDKYQYGHFDGMTDMYEYSNSRKDIPQTKYLSVSNHYSEDMYQKAWDFLRAKYPANAEGLPEDYKSAARLTFTENAPHYMTIDQDVFKLLNGSGFGLDKENSVEFWNQFKTPEPTPPTGTDDFTIREGTKSGYSEVLFPSKPSADVLSALKSAGFRWSRFNKVWYGKTENLPYC